MIFSMDYLDGNYMCEPDATIESQQGGLSCNPVGPKDVFALPYNKPIFDEMLWSASNELSSAATNSYLPSHWDVSGTFDCPLRAQKQAEEEQPDVLNETLHEPSSSSLSTKPQHNAGHLPSTKSRPSKKDWEIQRPTIIRLYRDDDYSLKDVMQIMQTQHGFNATVKMYKTRLTLWGIRKYMTRAERQTVCTIVKASQQKGDAVGKIIVRGKERRRDIFTRHMGHSRTKIPTERHIVQSGNQGSYNSMDIIIGETEIHQLQLPLPATLYPDCLERSFEIVVKEASEMILARPTVDLSGTLGTFLFSAKQRLRAKRVEDARILLNQAADWFYRTMKRSPTKAVLSLLRSYLQLRRNHYPEMFTLFHRHVLKLSQILYGLQSPMTMLLKHLSRLTLEKMLIPEAFHLILELKLANLSDGDKVAALRLRRILATSLRRSNKAERAQTILLSSLESIEFSEEHDMETTLDLFKNSLLIIGELVNYYNLDWEDCQNFRDYYFELAEILQSGTEASNIFVDYRINMGLGEISEKMNDIDKAVIHYRLSYDAMVDVLGHDDCDALITSNRIWRILKKQGRNTEAEAALGLCQLSDEFSEMNLQD